MGGVNPKNHTQGTKVECPSCGNNRALVHHSNHDYSPFSYKCRGCAYVFSARMHFHDHGGRYAMMFCYRHAPACYAKGYGGVCGGEITTNGSWKLLAEVVSGHVQKYPWLVTNNGLDIELEDFADQDLLMASMKRFFNKTNESRGWFSQVWIQEFQVVGGDGL